MARHLWCSLGLDTLGGHLGGLHGPCAGTPSGVGEVSQWDALNHPWIQVEFPFQPSMWKIPHLWKKIRSCTRKMSLSCNYLTLMYENDVLSVLMCLAIRFLGVNYLEGQEWVTS